MLNRVASRAVLCSGRSLSSASFSSPLSSMVSSSPSLSLSSSSSFRSFSSAPSTPSSASPDSKPVPLVSKPAQAVFKAAQKDSSKDTVDKVSNNLTEFVAAFEKIPILRFVASNPTLTPENKKKKFATLFPKLNYHPIAQEILLYYLSIGQGHKIKDLVKDYKKLATYYRNEVLAVITSAEKLSAPQLTKVTAAIKAKLSAREKLVLEQKVDPAIMGGMIIQVGEKSLDLSVASQIRKIDQAIRQI